MTQTIFKYTVSIKLTVNGINYGVITRTSEDSYDECYEKLKKFANTKKKDKDEEVNYEILSAHYEKSYLYNL